MLPAGSQSGYIIFLLHFQSFLPLFIIRFHSYHCLLLAPTFGSNYLQEWSTVRVSQELKCLTVTSRLHRTVLVSTEPDVGAWASHGQANGLLGLLLPSCLLFNNYNPESSFYLDMHSLLVISNLELCRSFRRNSQVFCCIITLCEEFYA